MKQMVVRVQLIVIELVVQIDVQLALGDRIAGIFRRIRREVGQLDIVRARGQIERRFGDQRIDRAANRQRTVGRQFRGDIDGRGRGRLRAERADRALNVDQVRREIRLDEVVRVRHAALLQHQLAEVHPDRALRRRCGGDRGRATSGHRRGRDRWAPMPPAASTARVRCRSCRVSAIARRRFHARRRPSGSACLAHRAARCP